MGDGAFVAGDKDKINGGRGRDQKNGRVKSEGEELRAEGGRRVGNQWAPTAFCLAASDSNIQNDINVIPSQFAPMHISLMVWIGLKPQLGL
jgi:hypothetical protein